MLRLLLLTVTNRQPGWVDDGYHEYAKRLRGRYTLELQPLALARRSSSTPVARAVADESTRMLAAIPLAAHVVALREQGAQWSTPELAGKLEGWTLLGAPICFLIGGPDGLGAPCIARANDHWALSHLTFPHGLVRILVAEALYRAASLLANHPYHRA